MQWRVFADQGSRLTHGIDAAIKGFTVQANLTVYNPDDSIIDRTFRYKVTFEETPDICTLSGGYESSGCPWNNASAYNNSAWVSSNNAINFSVFYFFSSHARSHSHSLMNSLTPPLFSRTSTDQCRVRLG